MPHASKRPSSTVYTYKTRVQSMLKNHSSYLLKVLQLDLEDKIMTHSYTRGQLAYLLTLISRDEQHGIGQQVSYHTYFILSHPYHPRT